MKYFIGALFLIAGVVLGVVGIFFTPKSIEYSAPVEPALPKSIPSPTITKPLPLSFSGSLLYSNERSAMTTISTTSGILKEIQAVWYAINSAGILQTYPSILKKEIHQLSMEAGLQFIPTVRVELQPGTSNFLSSHEKKLQTIGKIIDLVEQNNYDGIDINIETIPTDSLRELIEMLESLQKEMKSNNKTLSITLNYLNTIKNIPPETPIRGLGNISDSLRISVTDQKNPATIPQAEISNQTFNSYVEEAVKIFPKEKSILVIPVHGYEWTGSTVRTVTYEEAAKNIIRSKGSWQRDEASGELTGTYETNGTIRTLWFQDAKSIQEKINIGIQYGFRQFSLQYIGGEDPTVWSNITELLSN